MIQTKNTAYCLLLLLTLGITWGVGYTIARFVMTHDVPPLGYSFWQSLGPALVLSVLLIIRKQRLLVSRRHLQYYFVCGLTGILIPNTTMYFAAAHLPAGILSITVNIVPVIAYPLALITKLEIFCWQRVLGIVLASLGLICLILPHAQLTPQPYMPWMLISLLTPCSFAFCFIYIAHKRPTFNNDALTLSAGMLILSTIQLIPIVILTKAFYVFNLPFTSTDWLIVLEILLSSFGYVLLFQLIKTAGPVYNSLVDSIVVLTGVFWSYLIFGEQINAWTGLAIVLILSALFFVTQKQAFATLQPIGNR